MAHVEKRDNSTLKEKLGIRNLMLNFLADQGTTPVIMETHGGTGQLYKRLYREVVDGVVFETDSLKSSILAQQRPTWAVYQADCIKALTYGAGNHLPVNVLDVDPYGEPWPVIDAFFNSEREFPDKMYVVVNDGLRAGIQLGKAWVVDSLQKWVEQYGNDIYSVYLEIAQMALREKVAAAGYTVYRWTGYYCGHLGNMSHYLAELVK